MIERVGLVACGFLAGCLLVGYFYFNLLSASNFAKGQLSVVQAVCPQVVQAIMQAQQQPQRPAEVGKSVSK